MPQPFPSRSANGLRASGPAAGGARSSRNARPRCACTGQAAAAKTACSDCSGIHLGVVAAPELDRIELQTLGHLVHGYFQGHHARRLARRAHGISFRKIEHRKLQSCHSVLASVKQARLLHGRFRPTVRQIAGPALMANRRDLAITIRADPNALDRRRPMRRIVEYQRPLQCDLDRPAAARAAERSEHAHRPGETAFRRSRRR